LNAREIHRATSNLTFWPKSTVKHRHLPVALETPTPNVYLLRLFVLLVQTILCGIFTLTFYLWTYIIVSTVTRATATINISIKLEFSTISNFEIQTPSR